MAAQLGNKGGLKGGGMQQALGQQPGQPRNPFAGMSGLFGVGPGIAGDPRGHQRGFASGLQGLLQQGLGGGSDPFQRRPGVPPVGLPAMLGGGSEGFPVRPGVPAVQAGGGPPLMGLQSLFGRPADAMAGSNGFMRF